MTATPGCREFLGARKGYCNKEPAGTIANGGKNTGERAFCGKHLIARGGT